MRNSIFSPVAGSSASANIFARTFALFFFALIGGLSFVQSSIADEHGGGRYPAPTFTKVGSQINCRMVQYKLRFMVATNRELFADEDFVSRLNSARFNVRDQLPAGLQVTSVTVTGDVTNGAGGAPVAAIGSTVNPDDTVSIPNLRFTLADTDGIGGDLMRSIDITINARIDPASFPAPTTISNQASLEITAVDVDRTMTSHDPALPAAGPEDGGFFPGEPTKIGIDLTDCDEPHDGGGDPSDEACFKIEHGEVECSKDGDGTFTYRMNVTAGMEGRVIELVTSTPGVWIDPASQVAGAEGSVLEWTIHGATPGMTVSMSVVGSEISGGPAEGWGLCCTQRIEIIIPEHLDCPDKKPDIEVKKRADVTECTLGGGCKFSITVTNVGDGPYTGPIALEEVATLGPAEIDGGPNAPWTCVPNRTPMICKHPSTTLNPGESVTLKLSLRHMTRRAWREIINCAEFDYTASGWAAPFGDLTNDKSCARIPIRHRDDDQPKKTDLELKKEANSLCTPEGICSFRVTIRNVGTTPFNDRLIVKDDFMFGPPISVGYSPIGLWTCSSIGDPAHFECRSNANINLPVGAQTSIVISARVNPADYVIGGGKVKNCANVERVENETNLDNNRDCAIAQIPQDPQRGTPDLAIEKSCETTQAREAILVSCRVSVTNNGTAAAVGTISIDDAALTLSGSTPVTIQTLTTDAAGWDCTPVPSASLVCKIPGASLTPGTTRYFDVSMDTTQFGEFENCATGATLVLTKGGGQFGRACAKAGRELPEPQGCSPTFVKNDKGRCVCPKGTKYRGGKCKPSGGITPLPIPPIKLCVLKSGQFRTNSGKCVCRKGTQLNKRRSKCVPTVRQCKLKRGQIRTQSGACICRKGTRLNKRGSECVPSVSQCKLKPGQIRTRSGKCVCSKGRYFNSSRTRCVIPRVKCPKGTIGKYRPNCRKLVRCPKGTIGKYRPNCRKLVRCPKGTVGKYRPNCRKVIKRKCPPGTRGVRPNCKKIIIRTRRPRCKKGQFRVRGKCVFLQ
ncbi:MAG: hypothetical protein V3V02_10565 [Rhizobiaceae bacterium]